MSVTCGDLIKRGRLLYGRRTALIYEDKRFTYAAQAARMFRLANALIAQGVTKQQRVAVLARNCSEYVEIFGACEVAGFVAINLNSRLSAIELGAICRDCQPSVLIHAKDFVKEAASLAAEVPSIRLRIGIDDEQGDVLSYEKLLAEASADEPPIRPTAGDIAYLMYTSGTTGGAKGVMISHAAMSEATRMLSQEGGLGSIS